MKTEEAETECGWTVEWCHGRCCDQKHKASCFSLVEVAALYSEWKNTKVLDRLFGYKQIKHACLKFWMDVSASQKSILAYDLFPCQANYCHQELIDSWTVLSTAGYSCVWLCSYAFRLLQGSLYDVFYINDWKQTCWIHIKAIKDLYGDS